MNAREILQRIHDGEGMPLTEDAQATIESALTLLDAAERNDGKTPETDAYMSRAFAGTYNEFAQLADFARSLEQRCTGLAAEVVRLREDANTVDFYEREFYPLSNFSAFRLMWSGIDFDTSEAAYHWEKFYQPDIRSAIQHASSAHDAFKIAEFYKSERRADWDDVKVDIMRDILRAKATQHKYVRRKLLETGTRYLVEKSWRDAFWGCGPNKDGQNILGKLWMEVRAEFAACRAACPKEPT